MDISAAPAADMDEQAARPPEIPDPGPMLPELLRIPGFISQVMDHTLAIAPCPNPVMAFAGALALQALAPVTSEAQGWPITPIAN